MYCIESGRGKTLQEIRGLIRQGLGEHFPEIQRAVGLPFGNEEGNQIFFQNGDRILWCRIFFGPFGGEGIQKLICEMETLKKILRQSLCPYVFFPSLGVDLQTDRLAEIPSRFFEYRCVRGQTKEEILFTEYDSAPSRPLRASGQSVTVSQPVKPSLFFDQARLNRDELSGLIQISLDLRKLAV